jgi:RHS repeat-associated protein
MPTAPDENKTTRFEYNLDGNLVKLIAENATTGDQVTEWIYGVTVAQGSQVESKALVFQKVYPDSTGSADRVTYTYNRQGQVITMKDQAGTTHGYAFDKFGRIVSDAVSAFGSGIDQTVKAITRSYEVRGMLEKVSSLGIDSTPTPPVEVVRNEVLLTYNAYAQLAKDYQSHVGPVNTASTLSVAYSYADGSANTVRRTGITYPDGTTTITTAYVGADAAALSRPDALKEGSATLCSYRYLGAGVFIGVRYDAASNVELTYEDGGTGDAGDKYTGLDRFGRLIETLWKKGTAAQVQSKYGRNRFGGVVWRKDLTAHAQRVTTEDNFYQYDGLYQVKAHQRGNLTGTPVSGITNLQQEEDWTYDATGNWDSYSNTAPSNSQTRTNNKANEITQITNPSGNINPAYDPVGNMLAMPSAPGTSTAQYALKWDAWNRLVEVKDSVTVVASYAYDGLFRRLAKTNATETRNYFYNQDWRAVEERVTGASVAVDRQYTWGLRDRWDLLRRKRSTGGASLSEVHFCVKDYLDPMAIVGTDGLVKERFAYDAFGNVRFLASDYSSRSGSSFDWEFLFHAEFRDAETHLYNYGYRYYYASIGRWLSRDPIGEKAGVNLFAAFRNLPVSNVDVLGKDLAGLAQKLFPESWKVSGTDANGKDKGWFAVHCATHCFEQSVNRLIGCPLGEGPVLLAAHSILWEILEIISVIIVGPGGAGDEPWYDRITDQYANAYGAALAGDCAKKFQKCPPPLLLKLLIWNAQKCCDSKCASAQKKFMAAADFWKGITGGK